MNIVILAAGKGTRMHSDLPKVLQPVAGEPMVSRVIRTASALSPARTVVVIGHGSERVKAALAEISEIRFAEQKALLGTGDALRCALSELDPAEKQTLVLVGDVPLIRAESLSKFCEATGNGVGILTVELADPTGYGRIVKQNGQVTRIVEQKDASPEELSIHEINTGIMALPTERLSDWCGRMTNNNAQHEFYLTDFIEFAVKDGVPVTSFPVSDEAEVMGVNSKRQLA